MNIAKKIVISILTIVIVSGLIITGFVYVSERNTIEQLIRRELEGIVVRKMDKIDRFLFERRGDIELIVGDPSLSVLETDPVLITERLLSLRNAMKAYVSLSYFDVDRVCIADTAGLDIGKQRPRDLFWTKLEKSSGSYGGAIIDSFALKIPVIAFAALAKDRAGHAHGYVMGRVSLDKINDIAGKTVGQSGIESNMEIDLADDQGLLIYSSYNKKRIFQENLSGSGWFQAAQAAGGGSRIVSDDETGRRYLVVFTKERGYLNYPGHGWVLAARVPFEMAMRPATELRERLTIIILLVFLVAAVVSLRISHLISRPIVALHKATEAIGAGNLDFKVDIETKDEIGQLSRSFNEMMEKLKTVMASRDELDREIVRRERVEKEMQKMFEDLKQAQQQLVQSEKMASIGQLAAGVAHEINNPLAYIMGNLGSLKEYRQKLEEFIKAIPYESLDPQLAKEVEGAKVTLKIAHVLDDMPNLLDETLEGAVRIKNIVQGLRSFARPEGGDLYVVEINSCIETALALLMNELKYKAEVVKEYGAVPPVEGYPQQLAQVFMNILLNAAQAIEKHGTITIKTYVKNGEAVVEVSDTGCGISDTIKGKIFDPFFTTKDVGKGTGLGLSIAHGIVERHKGTIHVQSTVGAGTTFIIRLPLK